MIPGETCLACAPLCDTAAVDFSLPSLFRRLLADRYAQRLYLVEAQPYDVDLASEVTRRAASRAYITKPTDTPANTPYPARADNPYQLSRDIALNDTWQPRSVPSFGDLVITDPDGGIDDWLDLAWDGRDVAVKLGSPGWDYADFGTIFAGKAREIGADEGAVRIAIEDAGAILDSPLQDDFFAGTGGYEGGAELTGKPKPICLGQVKNIEPVLVDASLLRYRIHDGAIEDITAVYDRGVSVSYTKDLANGCFTLLSSPAGLVTCDAQGANAAGYVSTAGTIFRRIIDDYSALTDPDDLDTASFAKLEASAGYTAGFYARDAVNRLDALDALMGSVGGFWGTRRTGELHVGLLRNPGAPAAEFTAGDILALECEPLRAPAWRMKLGYRRNWRVMGESESAGAALATRGDLTQEYYTAAHEHAAMQTSHLLARDVELIPTLLYDSADATTVAQALMDLHGVEGRHLLTARLKTQPMRLDVGDTVRITYDRFGLDAGKRFLVIGIEESGAESTVNLRLWG